MVKLNKEQLELIKCRVASSTEKYCTPIIYPGPSPANTLKIVGSGTFVVIGEKKGILTNHHVYENWFFNNRCRVIGVAGRDQIKWLKFPQPFNLNLPYKEDCCSGIDLEFIILDDEACLIVEDQVGKQFWNLDELASEWFQNQRLNNELNTVWMIHGSVAQGSKVKRPKDSDICLDAKYVAPYIAVPDVENIQYLMCEYREINLKVRFDNIVCPLDTNDSLPIDWGGMSGGALWRVNLNSEGKVIKINLVGVGTCVHYDTNSIICRGPEALFKVFYPFCLGMLSAHKMNSSISK